MIHKSIKSQVGRVQNNVSGMDVISVKVVNCEHVEYIVGVYCPSNVHTTQRDWDPVLNSSSNKTLVLGDFNAHHSNWSYKTDSRGTQIFDSLIDNDLITLNDGRPTRVRLVNGVIQKSSPDISMVSSDLALKF